MTVRDEKDGELLCMGFSEFTRRWKAEEAAKQKAKDATKLKTEGAAKLEAKDAAKQPAEDAAKLEAKEVINLDTDFPLHIWLGGVEEGIKVLVDHESHDPGAVIRLRLLQHLLVDLVDLLDPEQLSSGARTSRGRVEPAPGCMCSKCQRPQQRCQIMSQWFQQRMLWWKRRQKSRVEETDGQVSGLPI
jgi:hypothetical protein